MSFDKQPLWVKPDGVQTRWASHENQKGAKGAGGTANGGRKGAACFGMQPGASYRMAEVESGPGIVRRIWVTISDREPDMLRGIRLDFYWDGCDKPAVSAPIGDFFGLGIGQMSYLDNALMSSPEARSFNCCIPMPFKNGMKMVVTNECERGLSMFFYDVNYTLGDKLDEETLYFHAHYRRENPTVMRRDFEILPKVVGKGRYLGTNIGVITDPKWGGWWGEGEFKCYLDGDDALPTLAGTGTEDYIGTGWGQGVYNHPYQGCPMCDGSKGMYQFYRWHLPDPIYFDHDIRITMQQIGCWEPGSFERLKQIAPLYHASPADKPLEVDFSEPEKFPPYGIFERTDDWSCCTYFYMDKPTNELPALDPYEKRIEGLLPAEVKEQKLFES